MTKSDRVNIIDRLITPGEFVYVPTVGRTGCVRSFNATTNEVEVSFAAIGLTESLERAAGRHEAFLQDLRDQNIIRSYHFSKLCVGADPNEDS